MWRHVQAAYERSQATGAAHQVIIYLAYRANDDDEAWPAHGTIAGDCNLSRRSVVRALAELEQMGEVTPVDGGRGATRRYRLNLCQSVTGEDPNLCQDVTGGVTDCHRGVTSCPQPVTDCHTNRSNGQKNDQENGHFTYEEPAPPLVGGVRYELPPDERPSPTADEAEQAMITAISAVCKETYVPGFGDERFHAAARAFLKQGWTSEQVRRFDVWWGENGHYQGRPALKSMVQNMAESISPKDAGRSTTPGARGLERAKRLLAEMEQST